MFPHRGHLLLSFFHCLHRGSTVSTGTKITPVARHLAKRKYHQDFFQPSVITERALPQETTLSHSTWTSLVVQRLRIHLPMQGTREDLTCQCATDTERPGPGPSR